MIDAELYTISVRKESVEGEVFYVARINELPDVAEFADSMLAARCLAIDTIETAFALCQEKNIPFPPPIEFNSQPQASGRVTLRMPKTLHTNLINAAEAEAVSLNQYIVSSLSMQYGHYQVAETMNTSER